MFFDFLRKRDMSIFSCFEKFCWQTRGIGTYDMGYHSKSAVGSQWRMPWNVKIMSRNKIILHFTIIVFSDFLTLKVSERKRDMSTFSRFGQLCWTRGIGTYIWHDMTDLGYHSERWCSWFSVRMPWKVRVMSRYKTIFYLNYYYNW